MDFLPYQRKITPEKQTLNSDDVNQTDLPNPVPSRSLAEMGRFSLVVLSEAQKKQSTLVPVLGLLLALALLSAGEKISDKLAVASLSNNKMNFSRLTMPSLAWPEISFRHADMLAVALRGYGHSRTEIQKIEASVLAITTRKVVTSKDIVSSDLRNARDEIAFYTNQKNQQIDVWARQLGGQKENLTANLRVAAQNLNQQVVVGEKKFEKIMSLTDMPDGQVAMSGRLSKNILTETKLVIIDSRQRARSTVARGDALLYQPVAILSSGLKVAGDTLFAWHQSGQKLATVIGESVEKKSALVQSEFIKLGQQTNLILANTQVVAGSIEELAISSSQQVHKGAQNIETSFNEGLALATMSDRAIFAVAEYSVASVDTAMSKTISLTTRLWYAVPTAVIDSLAAIGRELINFSVNIKNRWQEFVLGSKSSLVNSSLAGDQTAGTALLREQIRQELLNELEGEFGSVFERLRAGYPMVVQEPKNGERGVVIVPEGKTPESNAVVRGRLKQMFSDPINVKFDVDGQSGVVTPEFRSRTGENYIFLLTPIKK